MRRKGYWLGLVAAIAAAVAKPPGVVASDRRIGEPPAAEAQSGAIDLSVQTAPAPAVAGPDWTARVVEMQGQRRGGIVSAWLSNGVRVHHKRLELPPEQVVVTISLVGSELLERSESRGLSLVAACAWQEEVSGAAGAKGGRDGACDAVRAELTGRDAHVEASASPDALVLRVWGSREDIEAGLRAARLLLTRAKVTQAAFSAAAEVAESRAAARAGTPQGVIADALTSVLFPADEARTRPLTRDDLSRLEPEAVQKWLAWHIEAAPIEAAVVGDISLEQSLKLVAMNLGELSKRQRVATGALADARTLPRVNGAISVDLVRPAGAIVSPTSSMVVVGFRGGEATDPADLRTLRACARIIDQRATAALREAGFDDPRVGVSTVPATVYPGTGAVAATVRVPRGREVDASEIIEHVIRELVAEGPRDDEVAAAGAALAAMVDNYEREPRYWADILARLTTVGVDAEALVDGPAFYRGLTRDALMAVLARNATNERRIRVIVRAEG